MTDPVDEWVTQSLLEYEGKPLKSAEKGDLDIGQIDEKKKDEYGSLFEFIKSVLDGHVKEVKPSTHLKDSMACLSGDDHERGSFARIALVRCVYRHLLPARLMTGPTALRARRELIAKTNIGKCAAHHNLVITAPRSIRIEVLGIDVL